MNSRFVAVQVLCKVVVDGKSLTTALTDELATFKVPPRDKPLVQELCYGVLRWYFSLEEALAPLLKKSLKAKDSDIYILLLLGLYQLDYLRIPAHAAVSETVAVARLLKKNWAVNFVNGVLRQYQRHRAEQQAPRPISHAYPQWLLEQLQQAWPAKWESIIEASNQQAPMSLRVNCQKMSVQDYLTALEKANIVATKQADAPYGIVLENPIDVFQLPGFNEGWVSVQDGASQLIVSVLATKAKARLLDVCAAPGGKTAALLEASPLWDITAIDNTESRLARVRENLSRLQLTATVKCGDGLEPATWWDGQLFDAILLDAPCSATGVIRRHPDIKLLRKPDDIPALALQQRAFLEALWPLLKPGGLLLYATCSILPAENVGVLTDFLTAHEDASEEIIEATWGHRLTVGRQILVGEAGMDGFYYGKLVKGKNA